MRWLLPFSDWFSVRENGWEAYLTRTSGPASRPSQTDNRKGSQNILGLSFDLERHARDHRITCRVRLQIVSFVERLNPPDRPDAGRRMLRDHDLPREDVAPFRHLTEREVDSRIALARRRHRDAAETGDTALIVGRLRGHANHPALRIRDDQRIERQRDELRRCFVARGARHG